MSKLLEIAQGVDESSEDEDSEYEENDINYEENDMNRGGNEQQVATNFSKLKDRKNRQKKYRERVVPTTPTQPLILEYYEKNVTSLQEPVKTLTTPKAKGSSSAIRKTKIINKNVGKVLPMKEETDSSSQALNHGPFYKRFFK
ncbi:hypothetical protein JTB14_022363 [Gonioctena quinquepunctata]|nr:hypothetical protein JTB14_022363 [Gonioctena quinquepunctata]